MPVMLLIAVGLFAWLWWSGRLKNMNGNDWIALVVAVLGTRFMISGQLPAGGAMVAGAAFWGWRRLQSTPKPDDKVGSARYEKQLEEARILLGVRTEASEDTIRAAHRRLIGEAHPDRGGNSELARRLNEARDLLVSHLNQLPPK